MKERRKKKKERKRGREKNEKKKKLVIALLGPTLLSPWKKKMFLFLFPEKEDKA